MENKALEKAKKALEEANKAWNIAWEAVKATLEYKTYDEARKEVNKALEELRKVGQNEKI